MQLWNRVQAEQAETLVLRLKRNPASFMLKDKVELMKANRSVMLCD